jgi:DNA-binding transcriptional LysR family regulator
MVGAPLRVGQPGHHRPPHLLIQDWRPRGAAHDVVVGPHAVDRGPDAHLRLADLAGVPWALDPAGTASGQWARNACREAGFEPDVRYVVSDLLLQIHLAETGHAASVIPGLLLAAVRRPAARIIPLPGRPHRRLTTGVRAGATRHPAIRAFREALRLAVREAAKAEH